MDSWLIGWIGTVGQAVPDMFTTFINFLMVPFVMFYFIKDYWKIRGALYSFLPQEYQRRSYQLLRDMDEIMGGYLRGDIITSIFQALFIGIGLYFIGVPGAVLLALLSGFLNLIPLIGAYIAYIFAAIAALTTPDPMMALLWVTVLYAAEGVLETAVIGPQVFGRHTDLHALVVILSILIFGYFMGITGMLIAIPVTSMLVRFITRWRNERRLAVEREKVEADLRENPHHARKGELAPSTGG
jgi:predicted PurR-regulated permease PerM